LQVFNYTCIFAVSIIIGIYETSYYTGRDVFPRKAYPFLFPIFLAITANAAEQSSDNHKNNKNKYYYKDNRFILLHHFVKKTQKTPPREIDQAKRNLADFIERNDK